MTGKDILGRGSEERENERIEKALFIVVDLLHYYFITSTDQTPFASIPPMNSHSKSTANQTAKTHPHDWHRAIKVRNPRSHLNDVTEKKGCAAFVHRSIPLIL